MEYLNQIIADLESEKCVLIVGPDIIDLGEKSFFETMCADLVSSSSQSKIIDIAPQYVFPNEELLQLMPSARETKVFRMMEDFYRKQNAFDEPLTKIAQIPFHLIISLMPDDRLQKIFDQQGIDFACSHYPREDAHRIIEKPSRKKPLIYKLLGGFNEEDAVITFDHLFSFLSGVMGDKKLPLELKETLLHARTFIFLGVHFEKWYIQLLLRIITSNQQKDKYSILKNTTHDEVRTFVARRHELDFVQTEPLKFLDDIYCECKKRDLLKRRTTVFISYKSEDIRVAEKVEAEFNKHNINVIRDENSARVGQRIEDFIETIKHVDSVLFILSKDSLRSTWVSKEIGACLENRKKFAPCYIDKSFLDFNYWELLNDHALEQIGDIGQKITERVEQAIDDLLEERERWTEFKKNLPYIRSELQTGIAESLMPNDFDKNIKKVIHYILNKN